VLAALALILLPLAPQSAAAQPHTDPQTVLHLIDYIAVDYPAVVVDGQIRDKAEYKEQQEFAAQLAGLMERLPPRPEQAGLLARIQELQHAIQQRAGAERVVALCSDIAARVVQGYGVNLAPREPPPLRVAGALYQTHCAACHGLEGAGDGAQAVGLEPSPTNFRDPARQSQRSVYALYSTITLGVAATGMPGFTQLSEADRWALAFYLSKLPASDAERARGEALWQQGDYRGLFPDLAAVTGTTPADARLRGGADAGAVLAYLRANPAVLASGGADGALAISLDKLRESLVAYRAGDRQAAYESALAAYLQGFELMEPALKMIDPELRGRIEDKMARYRSAIKASADTEAVAAQQQELQELVREAVQRISAEEWSPLMGAFSAFVLLLREGLEAILVLAAIMAFLIKAERRDTLPYVHAGWGAALALGVLTWVLASQVISISGANRELTEGVTALIAAAMLLYVGYWLHSKTNAQRWQEFIRAKLHGAFAGRAMWPLVTISFLAVYREVFETILFYQTLWLQVAAAQRGYLIAGAFSAAVVLVALAWGIFRFSLRLPLRLFFTVNAVLLYVLALVFAGKGIAALQEADKLPVNPVNFPEIDLLGIYPNLEALGLQLVLIVVTVAWLAGNRLKARRLPSG